MMNSAAQMNIDNKMKTLVDLCVYKSTFDYFIFLILNAIFLFPNQCWNGYLFKSNEFC